MTLLVYTLLYQKYIEKLPNYSLTQHLNSVITTTISLQQQFRVITKPSMLRNITQTVPDTL